MDRDSQQVSAIILAAGLVIAALLVAGAVGNAAAPERFVEVEGLSEREVSADLAIWPISYRLGAESLDALRAGIARNDEAVVAFLKLNGFSDDELSRSPPRVTDRWLHGNPADLPSPRYAAERTLTLRSARIGAVRQAMGDATELIAQGVSLSPGRAGRSEFLFTALEEIEAEMIAEATSEAQRASRRFAEDSGSRVGRIRRVRQGTFSISARDPASPHVKTVRVVTTIEYALE